MIKSDKIILVVDDDFSSCALLHAILIKMNVDCVAVNTGMEAIELVQKDARIQLVLMDVRMPNMDGHECMQEIRKINKSIPVIAQTASVEDYQKTSYKKAGFDDYISKPIDIETLQEVIKKYL